MKNLQYDNAQLFEAFLKSAQYLVRLSSEQDVWEHLSKFIATHFPADWTALVQKDPVHGLRLRHCTLPEEAALQILGTDEVKNLLADALNTGFLATQVVLTPQPSMTAFLPIAGEQKVILIGHNTAEAIPKELLNTYLAIAGLAATTFERLRAEDEIKKLNKDLERRIVERTEGLAAANKELRREIAERKRAEERIAHIASFPELNPNPIVECDMEGRVIYKNPAMMNLFPDLLETGTAHPLLKDWTSILESKSSGKSMTRDVEVRDRVYSQTIVYHAETGTIRIYSADITERKLAEEALRESEAQFRTLADTIPHLCWMANADGWIFWYNNRWYEYTGTTPEQMEGWGWQKVHDPETLPKVLEQWQSSIATGTPFNMVFPLLGADGVFRPFLTQVMPVRDQNGKIVRWFGTNTDITEQKRSEEELEKLVDERTAELVEKNAQLVDEITERKRAEEALRLAGNYNRNLLEASLDPLVTIGPDGKITDVNAATETVTGYSRDRLIGTDFSDYFTEPEEARAGYQQVFREGAVRDYPLEVRHKDGRITPVLYNASVYKDDSGNAIGVFAAARDITEMKRAEDMLQKLASQNKLILDSAGEGILGMDASGNHTFANPAAARMLGWEVEELIGRQSHPMWHHTRPDGSPFPEEECNIHATSRQGVAHHESEEVFWKKDGTSVPVEYTSTPVWEGGKPVGVVVTFNDITERKRTEEALRESEEKFRLLVDSAQDYAIVMLDPDGRVASWNAGAQRMKGYTATEIIGKSFSCFYPEDDIRGGKPERELKIASETGRFEDEGLRARKDGSRFQANVVINAIRDKSGKLRGFSKITRDITERKRAEDEIKKLNEELEQRVVERTTELMAVNKELEAFTYSVSHDLRAPLRHIHGFVDLLVQGSGKNLDDKGKRYLTTISKAASQMGSLVDDLLSFSRMGRAEIKKHSIDLENMVYGVIDDMKYEIRERDVEWKVDKLASVYGDPSMLRLVMVNLISNAVKFTRQRDKAVIEIGSYTEAGGENVVYVRDNGVGFDMRYVDKLFGVFQRLHSVEEFEGTGIGLANIRRIISRHGGRTWAEGKLGEGAAFYFSLPSRKSDNV
jgi:PAS domain S-box-containing protein